MLEKIFCDKYSKKIIESIEENILTIRGNNIGKDKIIAEKDSQILFEKKVNVESIWMEG